MNTRITRNIDSSNAEARNNTMWRAAIQGLLPGTRYTVTIIATYEDESRQLVSARSSSIQLLTSSSKFNSSG